jgi:hypothetical protein
MRRVPIFLCLVMAAWLLPPRTASAVTLDEVIALSRAGVSEQVLLAMIDRDRTIYAIDADTLLRLRSAGVSEPVVLAMLRSGRGAPSDADLPPAPAPIPPPVDLVIVGHGPDRPDTGRAPDVGAVVALVPYPLFVSAVAPARGHRRGATAPSGQLPTSPFHVGPDLPPSPFHVGPAFPPFGEHPVPQP